jgi:hypothetical protein
MNPSLQWPLWKRVIFTNAIAVTGVFIGFASSGFKGFKSSPIASGYIAVFIVAVMNLMLLVVAPRYHAKKTAGIAALKPWSVLYDVLAERPLISALLILQFARVSQAVAATFIFFKDPLASISEACKMFRRSLSTSI